MKRLRILVGLALIAALLMGVFACAANTTTPSPTVQTTPQAPTAAAAVTPVASATPKTLATLTPTPTTVISNQEAKSSFTPANPRVEAIGEPVPGAEIYVELEPDTGPVGRYVTNG
ncbi:MAG: hypothetical protein Q7R34_13010, partial [Dehalococcoidia bacterium]|nr:hypothetical protein [Dehalococcoidia bacterium]